MSSGFRSFPSIFEVYTGNEAYTRYSLLDIMVTYMIVSILCDYQEDVYNKLRTPSTRSWFRGLDIEVPGGSKYKNLLNSVSDQLDCLPMSFPV